MVEKLLETVKVEVYLKRVRCPNPRCTGFVESDGKTRAENGQHGGSTEYRHICSMCHAGIWMKEEYPKTEYRPVPPVQHPFAKKETTAPEPSDAVAT